MKPRAVAAIHPTAVVDESASVSDSASIGPYAVVGPAVEVGDRVQIGPHAIVERDTRIAEDCRISGGAVIGADPQDLKYVGERTWLEIGPRTVIREFATLNRGTAAAGTTTVGSDCMIMAYVHVAHDCRVGDHVVLSNAVNMAGHVEIDDWAIVGGLTAIHQFVRVGAHSMIGGASRVNQDVAPFGLVAGNPAAAYGINRVGLTRRDFSSAVVRELKGAYRALFQSDCPLQDAAGKIDLDAACAEVKQLVRFVLSSERGITPTRAGGAAAGDEPGPS